MIGRISRFMTRFVSRWLPDPLIFAMLLTLLTFVIALWLTPQTPISMVKMWGDGFWNLLAFGMQMALIIVTGHALASSAPVKSLLRTAASAAKTPVQGVMLVTFFGSVACALKENSIGTKPEIPTIIQLPITLVVTPITSSLLAVFLAISILPVPSTFPIMIPAACETPTKATFTKS